MATYLIYFDMKAKVGVNGCLYLLNQLITTRVAFWSIEQGVDCEGWIESTINKVLDKDRRMASSSW